MNADFARRYGLAGSLADLRRVASTVPLPRTDRHRNSAAVRARVAAARVYRNGRPFVKNAETGQWEPLAKAESK